MAIKLTWFFGRNKKAPSLYESWTEETEPWATGFFDHVILL